jgi:SSS family solute:Na+ symporter
MRTIDWVVLIATLGAIVVYGAWKGRRQRDLDGYILAGRQLHWPTIALSIMATQASAITFLSTPGQAYADGMRFVQFYLGLPIAMILLSIVVVPIYHSLKVYTAYEYLEGRFGPGTRALTAGLFLLQRGLSTGITLYAPALIISVLLGWNIHVTNLVIGALVIVYTIRGTQAVSRTQVQQLLIALFGMLVAAIVAVRSLPQSIGLFEAMKVAGRMGRLNAIDFTFDVRTPYNFWSGMIGGLLVALSYFGTDQSQVQRYLTGATIAESRLGLLFNGLIKVPMQFFILFVGALVFVFYQFVTPPLFFNPSVTSRVTAGPYAGRWQSLEAQHQRDFEAKRGSVQKLVEAMRGGDRAAIAGATSSVQTAQARETATRKEAAALIKEAAPEVDGNDTNYIFLTFVIRYLPAGLVGLLLAAIFCAAMSATASGLNSLAATSVVDVYKRFMKPDASQADYVRVSRGLVIFWGIFSIGFAEFAGRMGSLIEAVNQLGSLFYGTILAIFILAFFFRKVGGTAAFTGALVGQAAVILCALFTPMAWLWWNVVGCAVGILASVAIETVTPTRPPSFATLPE